MTDLEYIKNFSKISITSACNAEGVDRSNLLSGRTTKENINKVRTRLESEVAKLYVKADTLQHR